MNTVVGPGYLKGGDIGKLLSAPSANLDSHRDCWANPEVVAFTAGYSRAENSPG